METYTYQRPLVDPESEEVNSAVDRFVADGWTVVHAYLSGGGVFINSIVFGKDG